MRRHLIYYRLRHLLQLAQDDVGRLVGEVLLDALVLEVVRGVASVELRDRSLVVLGVLAIGVVLLLAVFIEDDSLLAGILFTKQIQFKINFHDVKLHLSSHRRSAT